MHVISTCKYEKDRITNSREKSGYIVFSIITLWELFVSMKTGVLIRSGPKSNAAFPSSNDASDKIWLRLRDIQCLKV